MNRLQKQIGTQLRTVGRCAMMGTLIGLMTTQAFAAGAPAVTSDPAAAPETVPVANNASMQAIDTTPTANLPLVVTDNSTDATALPQAPNAPEEEASVTKPLDLRAMMDDAAQNTQNLQPAAVQQKHQVHPGWLALTVVGAFGMFIGAKGLTGTKDKGLAAGFLGGGAGLAGLGLYLTFK
jgi:hypothetical protein